MKTRTYLISYAPTHFPSTTRFAGIVDTFEFYMEDDDDGSWVTIREMIVDDTYQVRVGHVSYFYVARTITTVVETTGDGWWRQKTTVERCFSASWRPDDESEEKQTYYRFDSFESHETIARGLLLAPPSIVIDVTEAVEREVCNA